MFVTISTYRAKTGEEDAIIALHENQERDQQLKAKGYLSGELLEVLDDPRSFIEIARFDSETSAQLILQDPEQVSWRRRLVSLTEDVSISTRCQCVWQTSNEAPVRGLSP